MMVDETENDLVFMEDPIRTNYTLDEIADKVAELAFDKVLAKPQQLSEVDLKTGIHEPTVVIPRWLVINGQNPDQWPKWVLWQARMKPAYEFNKIQTLSKDGES